MGNGDAGTGRYRKPLPKPIKFAIGRVLITPGAATEIAEEEITKALRRHQHGDWGALDAREKACNEQVLRIGGWLLSAYDDPASGERFLIITQPDRMITTVMVPDEFGKLRD
jgi:hypothetical protein